MARISAFRQSNRTKKQNCLLSSLDPLVSIPAKNELIRAFQNSKLTADAESQQKNVGSEKLHLLHFQQHVMMNGP